MRRNEDLPCYANPYTRHHASIKVTLGKVIRPHETESFEGERTCAGFQVHEGLPAPIGTIESAHTGLSGWCLSQKHRS
jgi:hypothetical protein